MRFLIALLLLTACETTTVTHLQGKQYHISSSVEYVSWSSTPGPLAAQQTLNILAKQNCPSGWEVKKEWSTVESGKQVINRNIECL